MFMSWRIMLGKRDWAQTWHQNLGSQKKTPLTNFPNHLLENAWIKFVFSYALLLCHEGAKWNTIWAVRRTSANLPHCSGPPLAYPMENEIPLVHHVRKRWGCSCTIKDNKALNKRTWKHLMMKPMSKLITTTNHDLLKGPTWPKCLFWLEVISILINGLGHEIHVLLLTSTFD